MIEPDRAGSGPSGPRTSIWSVSSGEAAALLALLAVGVAARLPFWPRQYELGDALNYYIGALSTHVAHPPGSIGYCVLGGLLNRLIGNIQTTFITIGFCSFIGATLCTHFLAKAFGLRWPAAWLAAAGYSLSLNTLCATLLSGPQILEGMFVGIIALLGLLAIRGQSARLSLAMTIVFAAAGAFRPTTTLFLMPLWLYVICRAAPGPTSRWIRKVLLQLLVGSSIIFAWHAADEHYMAKAGYGGKTYEVQMLMPSVYEYANLSAVVKRGELRLTFHMPAVEFIAWVEVKTGLHLIPHIRGWPAPSLKRALSLMLMQFLKQSWWLTLGAPLAATLPLIWIVRRRWLTLPPKPERTFLLFWFIPAALFFVFGHMGVDSYLQIYLPALYIGAVYCLLGKSFATLSSAADAPSARDGSARSVGREHLGPVIWIVGVTVGSLAFFTLAHPFGATTGIKRYLDILALQHTGTSLKGGLATSRLAGDAGQRHDDDENAPYVNAKSDQQLLEAARKCNFAPLPVLPGDTRPPPP